jgi:hypothetical protein
MSNLFRWATEALAPDGMLALFEKRPDANCRTGAGMRRFDVVTMYVSLWLLASMVIDIATPKELTVYMICCDCASYRDHGTPALAPGAEVGLCSEFRDTLVGLRDSNRVDHAKAAVPACCPRGSRTDGDRRHRDKFPMLATFKAKDDFYLAGFGRLRLSKPVYISRPNASGDGPGGCSASSQNRCRATVSFLK